MSNLFDRMKLLVQRDKEFRSALYDIMGFYPHNVEFYRIAFAHKSQEYKSKKTGDRPLNNERLEFLGDAVLETVVSDIVYHHFKTKREGFLTNTRSKIVSRESLGKLAKDLGIDRLIQSHTNSKAHNSFLAGNAFEALMGAIYLDRGFDYAFRFIEHRIMGSVLDLEGVAHKEVNFKSKLLEWSQKNRIRIEFKDKQISNSGATPSFFTTIVLEGLFAGDGKGFSKKEAHQNASKDALTRMRREQKFIDEIFTSKEKRTAMEADPCFVLPVIDEIEDAIAREAKQAEKQSKQDKTKKAKKQDKPEAATKQPNAENTEKAKKQDKPKAKKTESKPAPAKSKPAPAGVEAEEPKAAPAPAKSKPAAAGVETEEPKATPAPTKSKPAVAKVEAEEPKATPAPAKSKPAVAGVETEEPKAAPAPTKSKPAVAGVETEEPKAAPAPTKSTPAPAKSKPAAAGVEAEEPKAASVLPLASSATQQLVAEPSSSDSNSTLAQADPALSPSVGTPSEPVTTSSEAAETPVAEAAPAIDEAPLVEAPVATATAEAPADEAPVADAAAPAKKPRRRGKRQNATSFTNTEKIPAETSHRAEKAAKKVEEARKQKARKIAKKTARQAAKGIDLPEVDNSASTADNASSASAKASATAPASSAPQGAAGSGSASAANGKNGTPAKKPRRRKKTKAEMPSETPNPERERAISAAEDAAYSQGSID